MFIRIGGDWGRLSNSLPGLMRVDLHFGKGASGAFHHNMSEVHEVVVTALEKAQEKGFQYVLFTHGYSTSGPFKKSSRSIVRTIMRSKESTPFIVKSKSLQHNSVFIAVIKPKNRH